MKASKIFQEVFNLLVLNAHIDSLISTTHTAISSKLGTLYFRLGLNSHLVFKRASYNFT